MGNEDSQARAKHIFGEAEFLNILVISELPASLESRQKSIELFRQLAIDHLIEFPLILIGIIEKISPYVSYAPSPTLQTMRLLKRYDFVRYQQMEFAFHNEAPAPVSGPAIGPEEPADVPEEELFEDID